MVRVADDAPDACQDAASGRTPSPPSDGSNASAPARDGLGPPLPVAALPPRLVRHRHRPVQTARAPRCLRAAARPLLDPCGCCSIPPGVPRRAHRAARTTPRAHLALSLQGGGSSCFTFCRENLLRAQRSCGREAGNNGHGARGPVLGAARGRRASRDGRPCSCTRTLRRGSCGYHRCRRCLRGPVTKLRGEHNPPICYK